MSEVVVFPGQGSQALGMGAELFPRFPRECDLARSVLGYSVVDICLREEEKLNQTLYTQPALFLVNALSFLAHREDGGADPKCLMGHSLGEINALCAAEAFSLETGLRLVKKRAELMSRERGGKMVAVIGLELETLQDLLSSINPEIDLANHNSPGQYVLSGKTEEIEGSLEAIKAAGAKMVLPLKVSGAFHSRHMKPARDEFLNFLKSQQLGGPRRTVIANCSAQPYPETDIALWMADQIDHPVLWIDSVRRLLQEGREEFLELGPGQVLTGLIKRIKKKYSI